jgi:aspartate/methionine/tyrosine aminotransferase
MVIPVADRLKQVEDYYFVKKLEEIAKLNSEGKNIINFGIGNPDMMPSKATIDALNTSASNPKHHGYQPYRGMPELRKAVADFYKKTYNVALDPATEVLPLLGSKEGILHISMAFLNAGDKVLVPNPGYPTYSSNANLVGAEIMYYDLKDENNWQPDLDAIKAQDLSNVKIMWLNYPHMPTGTPADPKILKQIIDFAHEYKILICFDNPYSLVLNKTAPVSLLSIEGAKDVCIELNSLSKSFNMAGWRVGMMIGRADYLGAALRVKSNIDSGMFLPVQQAAIEALNNSEAWHAERNAVYEARRAWVYQIFDLLGFTYSTDQVGMFVWAKAPLHIENVPAFSDQILYGANVFITPGVIFGSNGERFLRISLCVPADKMEEAYIRIKHWIGK